MGDVQVRIRDVNEADGLVLCQWPLDDLEHLIRELHQWGVVGHDDPTQEVVGQFKVYPEPHFEVIVGDSE